MAFPYIVSGKYQYIIPVIPQAFLVATAYGLQNETGVTDVFLLFFSIMSTGPASNYSRYLAIYVLRPTVIGDETRNQNRFSLLSAETRELFRR